MRMVSASVSPLATEVMEGWPISRDRPPSRVMAVSKDIRVRVDGSKNRLARMRPSNVFGELLPFGVGDHLLRKIKNLLDLLPAQVPDGDDVQAFEVHAIASNPLGYLTSSGSIWNGQFGSYSWRFSEMLEDRLHPGVPIVDAMLQLVLQLVLADRPVDVIVPAPLDALGLPVAPCRRSSASAGPDRPWSGPCPS